MTSRLRSVVVAGTITVAVAASAAAQQRGATAPRAASRAGRASAPPVAVADVKLDSLRKATTAPPPRVARNPFRFYEAPAPVAPPVSRPTAATTFVPPPAPVGPPPPPPIALRFIGLIEAPQRTGRIALLSDGRGGLMNGKEGDIIEGRYRVLRVGTDSIDLAYADGRGRQTIRLSGQ
ncbi:MAG TPA: hypothetical protein VIY56_11815 [Vicinamibacterales bacterium]